MKKRVHNTELIVSPSYRRTWPADSKDIEHDAWLEDLSTDSLCRQEMPTVTPVRKVRLRYLSTLDWLSGLLIMVYTTVK